MRSILRSSILAGIALWLLSPALSLADRPNIVLILADDMGWSDPGCYGSEIPTPALDTLARQGMQATRLYTASRCSPSLRAEEHMKALPLRILGFGPFPLSRWY